MLSPAQIAFFEDQGYLVLEDVIDRERVIAPIRAEYAELLDRLYADWFAAGGIAEPPGGLDFEGKLGAAYRAGCDWFQSMDISLPGGSVAPDTPMHFGPAVFRLVTDPRLLDLVEDLIGPEITSNPIQHLRLKPPAGELRPDEIRSHVTWTDWHQDRGVTLEGADQTTMVTAWCAITDATPENGCLQVIPGAHKEGMKPHCPRRQVTIADGQIDTSRAVPVPVRAGGVVIFHPHTPHASLVNRSRGFRWSFDLRYSVTGQPTGRDHFPAFVARSRAHPGRVLTDAAEWRALWEAARARLAAGPSVALHRWAGDSPLCA